MSGGVMDPDTNISSPHPLPLPYYGGPPYGNPLLARINSLESRISELERTLANLLNTSDDPHNKVRVEAQEVLRKRKYNDRDRGQGK